MYKKYELIPQSFTQGVAVEGVIKVMATYKSVDPEKYDPENNMPTNDRQESFEIEFAEGDEINWASVEAKVNDLDGIVSTYP